MELILLQRVKNLGKLGEKINVKPGYGRNFLIPQGKAVMATAKNLAAFEAKRAELERQENEALQTAQARAERLQALSVTLHAKCGDEGKLFGSIGPRDISEAITALGEVVEKTEVHMHNGPLRHIGEFSVDIQLHNDLVVQVPVNVLPTK